MHIVKIWNFAIGLVGLVLVGTAYWASQAILHGQISETTYDQDFGGVLLRLLMLLTVGMGVVLCTVSYAGFRRHREWSFSLTTAGLICLAGGSLMLLAPIEGFGDQFIYSLMILNGLASGMLILSGIRVGSHAAV